MTRFGGGVNAGGTVHKADLVKCKLNHYHRCKHSPAGERDVLKFHAHLKMTTHSRLIMGEVGVGP